MKQTGWLSNEWNTEKMNTYLEESFEDFLKNNKNSKEIFEDQKEFSKISYFSILICW